MSTKTPALEPDDTLVERGHRACAQLDARLHAIPDAYVEPNPRVRDQIFADGQRLTAHRRLVAGAIDALADLLPRLAVEQPRLATLREFCEEHEPKLAGMTRSHPDRFWIEHSLNVIKLGLDYDGGSMQTRLVDWLSTHNALPLLRGGGMFSTVARVTDLEKRVVAARAELESRIAQAEGAMVEQPVATTA